MKGNSLCAFCLVVCAIFFAPKLLTAGPLPKLKVRDLNGQKQNLSQYQGKTVILNFWATWCKPCQEEMPMLVEEEARYRDRGVVVVGISLDNPGDEEKVKSFVAKLKIGFPVWVGGSVDDLDHWKMGPAVPATAFIDADGNIVGRVSGELRRPALEHRLDWMLGNHQGEAPAEFENNLNPK